MYKIIYVILIAMAGFIFNYVKVSKPNSFKATFPNDDYFISRYYPDIDKAQNYFYNQIQNLQNKDKQKRSNNIWQLQGPFNIGGRVNTVAIKPNDNNILLIGTPNGGIYRSTNAGSTWEAVFDNAGVMAVSTITFDKANPNIVYAGTGDVAHTGYSYYGAGIYKSIDAGITWSFLGLKEAKIVTDIYANGNKLYVGVMGSPYVADSNRGFYTSNNAGLSFTRVLLPDTTLGVYDFCVNPLNENTIYASSWYRQRSNFSSVLNSNKTAIYKSTNGGNTWQVLNTGYAANAKVCKIGLAISQQDTNKLYAAYVDSTYVAGNLYLTTNGGASWSVRSNGVDINLGGFGWYFGEVYVNPANDNIVYVNGIELNRSVDGGQTFSLNAPTWSTYEVHADKHHIAFVNASSYYLATDGGLSFTANNGDDWISLNNFPITQFYEVTATPHHPNYYFGGAQDNGNLAGNSTNAGIYERFFGGDGYKVSFDNTDSNNVFCETQYGNIYASQTGVYGFSGNNTTSDIVNFERTNWNTPYIIDKNDPLTSYMGTSKIYVNYYNQFVGFSPTSNDLTNYTPGNADSNSRTISCISQSAVGTNVLLTGTTDGNVWKTMNRGTSWTKISNTLPLKYVSSVANSVVDSNTFFVSYSGYRDGDSSTYIYKSTDAGTTWVSIASNLPNVAINDIFIYPKNKDSAIAIATDAGVYATNNAGATWFRVGSNMPYFPVFDVEYDSINNFLVAGTFSRGIMTISVDSIFKPQEFVNINSVNKIKANIFPNPTNGSLTLQGTIGNRYEIYNATGVKVSQGILLNAFTILNIQSYTPGNYYVKIYANKQEAYTQAIVKY
jgi:photosystem II stability/assembly factor-like uncharacterized protein